MPKISLSIAKALLEEAGVKPEEASAVIKELIIKLANFRVRFVNRYEIIKFLINKIIEKINEVINAFTCKELNFTICLRKCTLTNLLDVLEDTDLLLEILKDVELDEVRKTQISFQQRYIRFIKRRIGFLNKLIINPSANNYNEPQQSFIELSLFNIIINAILTSFTAVSDVLLIEKFLLENKGISKEIRNKFINSLEVIERYLKSMEIVKRKMEYSKTTLGSIPENMEDRIL